MRYKFTEIIGHGASSKVFIADSTDPDDDESHFAIKAMPRLMAANKTKWINETRILQSVQHPNIVPFIESDESDLVSIFD